jgi:CRP-like cAMP-binding protein
MIGSAQTLQWYLDNFSLFNVLSGDDRKKLGQLAQMQSIKKDQVVYQSFKAVQSFYLIKEGKVKIIRKLDNGKEILLSILGPGELFGEQCIADCQEDHNEVAITAEESMVCLFNVSEFQALMNQNPRLTLHVTKLIGSKFQKVQRRLESLIFKNSEERVRELLKDMAHEYGYMVANNPNEVAIPICLTHEDIGKLTATSRQTVTSILNNLSKAGILSYDRHRIYIKNLERV